VRNNQNDNGTDYRHDNAAEIEVRNASGSENAEEVTTDCGAGHSQKMCRVLPLPVRLTILLPTNPAIKPRTIHVRIDITFHLEIGITSANR
jgi:hypothetical protein